jgi:hypothetical protein
VVQLHAETVSRVDVTDVSRDDANDSLVSVAIGDDRSGVRLLGQLRDVHRLVVEADRQLTRRTTIEGSGASDRSWLSPECRRQVDEMSADGLTAGVTLLPSRRAGGEVDQRTGLSKGGSEPPAADGDEAVVRCVLQVEQAPESRGRRGTAGLDLANELLGVVVILRP